MKYLIVLGIASFLGGLTLNTSEQINGTERVWDVLERLGEDGSKVKPDTTIKDVSARIGEQIVLQGFANVDGMPKARRQSKHFVCTSCHNIEREDPNLTVSDPQARLIYTHEKGLPFLQASPLYGVANREYYYNGDYERKYGDLVRPARESIRGAVQLCATECAQGRPLKDWEMESILAYLWEIQLKMDDLNLTDAEKRYIEGSFEDTLSWPSAVAIIMSKYSISSPATFIPPPPDRKVGTGLEGDPENGKLIYENSCLHCHYQKRYSFLHLDDTQMSFDHLNRKIDTYDRHSIYQVVRYGTYSKYWKQSYMPQYTEEKMSNQMLADLRAYIEKRAES